MSLEDTASLTALFSSYNLTDVAEENHFDPFGDIIFGEDKRIRVGIALIGMSDQEYLSRANTSARDKIDKELYARYFSEEMFEFVYIPFQAEMNDVYLGEIERCMAAKGITEAEMNDDIETADENFCKLKPYVSEDLDARIKQAFAKEGAIQAQEYHFHEKYGEFRANAGKMPYGGDARTYMTVYGDKAGADSSIDHIIRETDVAVAVHERLHIFTLSDGYDEAFWENGGKEQALAGNNTEFFVDDPHADGWQPQLSRQNSRIKNALIYSMGQYPNMEFCHYNQIEDTTEKSNPREAIRNEKVMVDIIQICGPNIMANHTEDPTPNRYNQDLEWPELNPFQNAYLYDYLGHKKKEAQKGGNIWQRMTRQP